MTETPLPYASRPQTEFEAQYKRIFEAAECRTQVELAAVLEIRQSSISDAKRRKAIPAEWRVTLFEKKRVNPEWILYGEGGKYLTPTNSEQNKPHVVKIVEVRPPEQCSAQDLINELVRRALQKPDIEAFQKEVANSWQPRKTVRDEI